MAKHQMNRPQGLDGNQFTKTVSEAVENLKRGRAPDARGGRETAVEYERQTDKPTVDSSHPRTLEQHERNLKEPFEFITPTPDERIRRHKAKQRGLF